MSGGGWMPTWAVTLQPEAGSLVVRTFWAPVTLGSWCSCDRGDKGKYGVVGKVLACERLA